ncbi:MAG: hypothetical protein JNM21_10720 [Taibaiella sp.]|nr:hypothetical protein [Taibaiella sp.]
MPHNAAKERNRELGILSQFYTNSREFGDQLLIGIQLKQHLRPQLALRALAAYNRYEYSSRPLVLDAYNNDSLRMQATISNANMVAVGIGLEAQRHFYKKIWLFAALELQAGHGTGKTASSSDVLPYGSFFSVFPNVLSPDYKTVAFQRTYVRLLPGVGAKIVFDRVNFGLETQFAHVGIQSEKTAEQRTTIPVIDVFNNMTGRFNINYRF